MALLRLALEIRAGPIGEQPLELRGQEIRPALAPGGKERGAVGPKGVGLHDTHFRRHNLRVRVSPHFCNNRPAAHLVFRFPIEFTCTLPCCMP